MNTKNICKYSFVIAAAIAMCTPGHAAQAPNARGANVPASAGRAESRNVSRAATNRTDENIAPARSARTAVSTRRVADGTTISRSAVARTSSAETVSRAASTRQIVSNVNKSRAATSRVARAATPGASRVGNAARSAMPARSAARVATPGAAIRSGMARATALYTDVSKLGGGYGDCRDTYATCMDQFCGQMNETFRRCFCSERFREFRDVEMALDEAKILLQRFEDNNLNAVDKTADEVNAMYSATVGEMAIKNDTSGAAALLGEIGDLLSGKRKSTEQTQQSALSMTLDLGELDFSTSMDDIWGGGGSDSLFGGGDAAIDITTLEGKDLYDEAHKQCTDMVRDACKSTAVFNMARSSYSILVTQDCNAYAKKIDSQKSAVENTVRTAEKYLREARLEEFRAHNDPDVNACMDKVRTAMLGEYACGPNYKRCLDPTGAFVNQQTGEPIYSPRLFQLKDLIKLNGTSMDIIGQNGDFSTLLDSKKQYAEQALDSCRRIADNVWNDFKNTAMIEIAQAQDEKIEEVKMSCVSTMKQCYDQQSSALKDFDDTTAQVAGALSAYAARDMCKEKVVACATLYGDADGCIFDNDGNYKGVKEGKKCGLTSLLAFVDSVDDTRVGEGCATAVESYLTSVCGGGDNGGEYPWNCRMKKIGKEAAGTYVSSKDGKLADNMPDAGINSTLWANVKAFVATNCTDPTADRPDDKDYENAIDKKSFVAQSQYNALSAQVKLQITNMMDELEGKLASQLQTKCEELDGYWVSSEAGTNDKQLKAFNNAVYGSAALDANGAIKDITAVASDLGMCVENSTRTRCLAYNSAVSEEGEPVENMASYNLTTDECTFTEEWYKLRCSMLSEGYWENGMCYTAPSAD